MTQAQTIRQRHAVEHDTPPPAPTEDIRDQQLADQTDELLDQIDTALQENVQHTCMCVRRMSDCWRNQGARS